MRNKLLFLYGINLLQLISHAGEPLNNNSDQTEIKIDSNLQEEQIINIWQQQLQDLISVEELQLQVLEYQDQIYKIQAQIKSDQKQNTYISKPDQKLEKLEKKFENRFDSFESRLNQYLSNISKIKNLRQKIDDKQKEIINILKEKVDFFKFHFEPHPISEKSYNIVSNFIDKLEKVININNKIDFINHFLSSSYKSPTSI